MTDDAQEDYYQAQFLWPANMKYHKSHGLYSRLPEKVNPEVLDPNVSSTTKADDVKQSYGASAGAAAQKASSSSSLPEVKLKDGTVVGADGADPAAGDTTAPAPAPTTIGAPTDDAPGAAASVEPVEPVGAGATGDTDPASTAKKDAWADAPEKPAPKPVGGGGPIWELNVSSGWTRFRDDCHDHIEKQYQKFLAKRGDGRIKVKTMNDWKSLDFNKMSLMSLAKKKGGGSQPVLKVRRMEGP